MADPNGAPEGASRFDVVICGGGLSGLLLARQLRREQPDRSVAVVEKTTRPVPDACHKVGESSVELGSQYLERLGLEEYLLDRHLIKLGLRFFPGGGHMPVEERTEIGPCAEPIVRSYQLDRGRLEGDLRDFLEADGVTLIEGAKVTDIDVSGTGDEHRVDATVDGKARSVTARWVVDATGRSALLRRGMKMTRGSRHTASAGWFRIKGKLDMNDMVPESNEAWHRRPCAKERWRSTNHFMGAGYWAWIIPLSTGNTSIGLVIHQELHDAKNIAGLDNTMAFLREHEPHLAARLEKEEVLDFLCLNKYSHTVARAWSEDRWALVGEAGAFVDPLYSPGTDFISIANCFTAEMIRADYEGQDLKARASFFNTQYRALVTGAIDLFRQAAPVYGHATAMATKIYWDNFSYWSFTCQYMKQELYKLDLEQFERYGNVGRRFLELANGMQAFLRNWALMAPEEPEARFRPSPTFPSVLVDCHTAIAESMTLDETYDYMTMRVAQAEEIASEIVVRVVQELGVDEARKLLEEVRFHAWRIQVSRERLDAEKLGSQDRRRALPELARDVERTLGKVRRHETSFEALELLVQPRGESLPAAGAAS